VPNQKEEAMKYRANPVEVEAQVIIDVGEPGDVGQRRLTLKDGTIINAGEEYFSRMVPVSGDYYVVQADQYAYVNPKEVFERKYSPIS